MRSTMCTPMQTATLSVFCGVRHIDVATSGVVPVLATFVQCACRACDSEVPLLPTLHRQQLPAAARSIGPLGKLLCLLAVPSWRKTDRPTKPEWLRPGPTHSCAPAANTTTGRACRDTNKDEGELLLLLCQVQSFFLWQAAAVSLADLAIYVRVNTAAAYEAFAAVFDVQR